MKKIGGEIKKIEASIGGYFSGQTIVVIDLTEHEMTWEHRPSEETMVVKKLTPAMEKRLLQQLEKAKVLEWEEEYKDPSILDGTQWEVKIAFEDKTIYKDGSNAYPKEWKAFCRSISKLTGKPFD